MNTIHQIKGGTFLLETPTSEYIFTPEDYTEEHLLLRASVREFINQEIEPNKTIFDSKEGTKLAPQKLEQFGALGFLGLAVPEKFGGAGCDIKTDLAVSEVMCDSFSFSQSLGIQKGLGINTILFYGNEAQQAKYLEGIISGQIKCAYCLTEPHAGSDANAGKTKAVYSEDGKHFILNGQKMWITNSGFADVFSVFCKIEDDPNMSCLIVEKKWGVQLGAEEKKLGIHGSSTRQVFFENVKVPVENLLGERNNGLKIAMDALNMGRLAIGIAGSAIAKRAFRLGIRYANERFQFKQPISAFGAIQEKIAKMAASIYALEAAWNRLGGDMDILVQHFTAEGVDILTAKQKVANDFATECAMIKVLGSETEQFVVDEALQMHGGMGYSGESEISILYRNIRGNRIYEGTNEINRLVIPGNLLRKAFKGELPLMEKVMTTFSELQAGQLNAIADTVEEKELPLLFLENAKKATLLTMGLAAQKYQGDIKNAQEVLTRLSNLLAYTYFIESAILRANKHASSTIHFDLMLLYLYEKADLMKQELKEVIYNCSEKEAAMANLKAIQRLLNLPPKDIIQLRQKIAKHFIQKNDYKLSTL